MGKSGDKSAMENFRLCWLALFLSIVSCDKERFYSIEGKEIIIGEYYLLLDNNSMGFDGPNNYSSSNNMYTGVPDPYGSGKVDKETYDSVDVGDKYCP